MNVDLLFKYIITNSRDEDISKNLLAVANGFARGGDMATSGLFSDVAKSIDQGKVAIEIAPYVRADGTQVSAHQRNVSAQQAEKLVSEGKARPVDPQQFTQATGEPVEQGFVPNKKQGAVAGGLAGYGVGRGIDNMFGDAINNKATKGFAERLFNASTRRGDIPSVFNLPQRAKDSVAGVQYARPQTGAGAVNLGARQGYAQAMMGPGWVGRTNTLGGFEGVGSKVATQNVANFVQTNRSSLKGAMRTGGAVTGIGFGAFLAHKKMKEAQNPQLPPHLQR